MIKTLMDWVKYNLKNDDSSNILYDFTIDHPEEISEVKKLLQEDYGYLDIVLDKDDFDTIMQGFVDKNKFTRIVSLRDGLIKTILQKIDDYNENDIYFVEDLRDNLVKKSMEHPNQAFRIHMFLDHVDNEYLQAVINDLIAERNLSIVGYYSNGLKNTYTSNGFPIEPVHDYKFYGHEDLYKKYEEIRQKEIEEEYERRREK